MVEFTSEVAGRLVRGVLFFEWHQLISSGYVTEAGLLAIRTRLDETNREFAEGPDKELLRIKVNEAIARARGIDACDIPGHPPAAPDDASEITDGNL